MGEAWLAWVRHGLQPTRHAAPGVRLNTLEAARWLRRHQLAPFFAHVLPGEVAGQVVARQNLANTRRSLRRVAMLLELGAGLEEAGIPWLAVKGPVLAVEWWGGPERRRAGDLDLVVPEGRIREVDAWLRGTGWRRTKPDFELTARQWREYPKVRHELGYVSEQHENLRVELHWRLEGVDDLEARLAAPHRVGVAGRVVPTLSPEVHLRYLCRHGARHAWFRLFWLLDIAKAFQREGMRWEAVLPGGAEDGSYRAVAQAAWLTEGLLGVSAPAGLLPAGRGKEPVVGWLAGEARAQMEERRSQFRVVAVWARQWRYRTALEPGWAGVRAASLPHWQSPLNWPTLPLPDRWFWLYPWLSPFLWVWRVWKRRGVGGKGGADE